MRKPDFTYKLFNNRSWQVYADGKVIGYIDSVCNGMSRWMKACELWERREVPVSTGNENEDEAPSDVQVGGDHYRSMKIQPSEFIYKNSLNWLQGNAIKYICRFSSKGGLQDIDKAIHYLELLKEWRYGKTEEENPDTPF